MSMQKKPIAKKTAAPTRKEFFVVLKKVAKSKIKEDRLKK